MNGLKTAVLLAALSGVLLMVGNAFYGREGLYIACLIALCMNFGSYWFSDKIVLRMYGARIVDRTQSPKLHQIVEELCMSAGMEMPRIALIDMRVPNAFATGRNQRHAVVAITPVLLDLLNERELRAVIAHELGHIKNKDILISSVAAMLATAISYIAQSILYFGGGGRDRERNVFGMLLMMILAPVMASLIQMAISRSREYGADDRSAEFTGSPMDLASALEKLESYADRMPLRAEPKQQATAHLFIVNPFRLSFMSRLFSTHPPIEERIARLRGMR